MKIKTKLISGVGLLFALIILLSTMGIFYVNALKRDTNNILVANYNTLEYSRNMLLALEKIATDRDALSVFEKNLDSQKQNVTENGEQQATADIVDHFNNLKLNPADSLLTSRIREDIAELMRLNMEAIERKSSIADATADNAVLWISVIGTACFLIAFVLLVNLPGNIANPIRELTESIKQIANQNYCERVHFQDHNEFGELAKSFNTMAEKLEEYSESKLDKIIKGKKRIEALINNMHDPVIGIDEDKKVLFANEEALKISGLKTENFIGKQIQDIAVNNDLIRDLIKDLIHPDLKKENENSLKIFANGKESYFEKEIIDINIIPTGEQQSQLIGHVIMLRNITLFKELDLAKTNFIGTVSHEFKTPISSMKMSLQLLENENVGSLNKEQKQLLESITEDTDRLLKITSELLNLAQVESGNMQLNISAVNTADIVRHTLKATKTQAEQKNIKIAISIEDHLPEIQADSQKTTWVLINLLSNAIRYSYDNSVVHLSLIKENNNVKFLVKDSGTGISEKYQNKIFERYFRVPGTQKEGTGLGLAICKEFIEAQGGSIEVVSEPGTGSTFSFTITSTENI
ncbi:ATP-binding protein [Paenimyroides baculatum]|uniref:histidine kinase n=1 Tax=Paenimyroides baculatum TaxID=2608000 RepID=A0A5M6CWZ3_9FLAO|nr:ATP-binding protein [Paenimyroides baculatum]KAA5537759.1 cell wall metabolism sensor histidine kinase WalK [Paenimyroides baculatum]